MSNCQFVLTEFDNEHNYNFCDGVFDTPDLVLGKILGNIIDCMDGYKAEEVKIRFEHDDANDDFYDIVCKIPRKDCDPPEEQEQVYRVFYLREQEIGELVVNQRTVTGKLYGECPSCGRGLSSYHDGNSGDHITKFCYNCGRAVKWE